jgi:hypothetical protein
MDQTTTWKQLIVTWGAGLIRHAVTTIGGMLVADGIISPGDDTKLAGSVMIIVGIAWSWWQKRGQAQAIALVKSELAHFRDKSAALQVQLTATKNKEAK